MDVSPQITTEVEIWQVDAAGTIYEAQFDEMTQWIFEGALLPQDKVRRANLRWIEAQRVPSLNKFFNAKQAGEPMPVITTTNAVPFSSGNMNTAQTVSKNQAGLDSKPAADVPNLLEIVETRTCLVHIETKPKFVCNECTNVFCVECTTKFGGSVWLCPMCGGMCRTINEVVHTEKLTSLKNEAIASGFGITDFFKAIFYPLKFKTSLIFGGGLYIFFSFGSNAYGIGGSIMIAASIFCWMLSNMLTFGVLANTVENSLQGNITKDFMPAFEDFSFWDDAIQPLFLTSSAHLISFAPLLLVLSYGLFVFIYGGSNISPGQPALLNQTANIPSEIRTSGLSTDTPSLPAEGKIEIGDQVIYVREVTENADGGMDFVNPQPNETPINPALTSQMSSADEEKYFAEINRMITEGRKQQMESPLGTASESGKMDFDSILKFGQGFGTTFFGIGFIAFLWGFFFLPSALITAAYTRNVNAIVNPMIGLDTIKRLGFDYVKILIMGLLLAGVGGFIVWNLNIIFADFTLPKVGNFPVIIIGSFVWFYISVVFSILIGFALFKNLDSFNLFQNQRK